MPNNDMTRQRESDASDGVNLPAVRVRHLFAVPAAPTPERRRMPRRQTVAGCAVERRGTDRRQRRPGVDGLLRTVLSDSWH